MTTDVFSRLQRIIIEAKAELVALKPTDITPESKLGEPPIAMDSIDFVKMVVGIETEFGLVAGDELFAGADIKTVSDLVNFVNSQLALGK